MTHLSHDGLYDHGCSLLWPYLCEQASQSCSCAAQGFHWESACLLVQQGLEALHGPVTAHACLVRLVWGDVGPDLRPDCFSQLPLAKMPCCSTDAEWAHAAAAANTTVLLSHTTSRTHLVPVVAVWGARARFAVQAVGIWCHIDLAHYVKFRPRNGSQSSQRRACLAHEGAKVGAIVRLASCEGHRTKGPAVEGVLQAILSARALLIIIPRQGRASKQMMPLRLV